MRLNYVLRERSVGEAGVSRRGRGTGGLWEQMKGRQGEPQIPCQLPHGLGVRIPTLLQAAELVITHYLPPLAVKARANPLSIA